MCVLCVCVCYMIYIMAWDTYAELYVAYVYVLDVLHAVDMMGIYVCMYVCMYVYMLKDGINV